MDFLVWHGIAMFVVVAVSFGAGYYTATVKRRNNEQV
jgi:hypothetical protein|tara:strand:+ start:481 stop:591 length:111 start_codon:yes stop_codon:yes gene_type:complete